MFKVINGKAIQKYRIYVEYADGVKGEVDLSHLAGKGVFKVWDDPGVFENVSVGSSGEIKWNDQLDLCPDSIYLRLTGKSPEEVFPNLTGANVNA